MSSVTNLENKLVKPDVFAILKTQIAYKLRVHAGLFTGLFIFQLFFIVIGILFFRDSTGMTVANMNLSIIVHNASNVIGVTFFWAFITGLIIANAPSKELMQVFVVDNKTNHIANGVIMLIMSIIAGVTAFLANYLVYVGVVLLNGMENITLVEILSVREIMLGICVTTLYVLFILTTAYLIRTLVRLSWLILIFFILLIVPTFIFGLFISYTSLPPTLAVFYFKESSVILFSVKILLTSTVFIGLAMVVSNRQEAR